MARHVNFGGVDFYARGYRAVPGDSNLLGIVRNGLQGFDSAAARRGDDVAKPSQDGTFAFTSFASSAIRTIQGVALATSEYELLKLRDRLMGLASGGRFHRLTYTIDNRPRWALAQVWDTPTWEWDPWKGFRATFSITVRSPDPHWYTNPAPYPTASTATLIPNYGNAEAWPEWSVPGARAAGWWVEAGGNRLTVDAAIPSGRRAIVDSRTGRVRLDNGLELNGVSGVEPVIPIGSGLARSSGPATLTLTETYT